MQVITTFIDLRSSVPTTMKIITWNCNGALRKKYALLDAYKADIVVVQECENPEESKDAGYRAWAANHLWIGDNKHKGLGIFCKKKIKLVTHNWENDECKYFISARVNDSFNLLAVWCHAKSADYQYIGQLWKYLQVNKGKLQQAVILGDLNSNSIWDRPSRNWNHSDVVRELEDVGIRSVYHERFKERHGAEKKPTFFLHRNKVKPYHLDYVFASREMFPKVRSVKVGDPEQWLQASDHLPMVVSI